MLGFRFSLKLRPKIMMMLNQFRNSVLCKCFQILLLGYFLMSSLNFSGSIEQYQNNNTNFTAVEKNTYQFFYKIFKWDKFSEELEENENKEAKRIKFEKEISVMEYLIPFDASWRGLLLFNNSKKNHHLHNPMFLLGFHAEIHLPPPQFFI